MSATVASAVVNTTDGISLGSAPVAVTGLIFSVPLNDVTTLLGVPVVSPKVASVEMGVSSADVASVVFRFDDTSVEPEGCPVVSTVSAVLPTAAVVDSSSMGRLGVVAASDVASAY